jgi:protease-4
VVVSMAGLAASGGYWISMAADEVIADEATLTGSIGVVGLLPSAHGALDKLGVNVAGVSTTWLTGQGDPRRALDPRFLALMQTTVDGLYGDFTRLVAAARKSTPEKIHELAQGRVWSGKDALAHGLVDRLGNQGDAVASAIKRAKLPDDTRVQYVEQAPGKLDRLLQGFGMAKFSAFEPAPGGAATAALHASLLATGLPLSVVQAVGQDLAWLAQASPAGRPYALAAHCLCAQP